MNLINNIHRDQLMEEREKSATTGTGIRLRLIHSFSSQYPVSPAQVLKKLESRHKTMQHHAQVIETPVRSNKPSEIYISTDIHSMKITFTPYGKVMITCDESSGVPSYMLSECSAGQVVYSYRPNEQALYFLEATHNQVKKIELDQLALSLQGDTPRYRCKTIDPQPAAGFWFRGGNLVVLHANSQQVVSDGISGTVYGSPDLQLRPHETIRILKLLLTRGSMYALVQLGFDRRLLCRFVCADFPNYLLVPTYQTADVRLGILLDVDISDEHNTILNNQRGIILSLSYTNGVEILGVYLNKAMRLSSHLTAV